MKRRSFVKASLLTGAAAGLTNLSMASAPSKKSNTQLYELRVYTLKDQTQQKLVEDYFQNALIPALNRFGSKSVGVFTELKPVGQTRLFALIPFNSHEDFFGLPNKLADDDTYKTDASAYLNSPLSTPAYDRIESSLLQAFTGMPQLEVPEQKQRLFELRRYESSTENAGKKKISMFNEGKEIGIFKRLGFKPIFYSETLIGSFRPNLMYMVTFDDMDAHDRLWKAFGSDADWKRISTMPEYPDALVSRITSTFLSPTAYSQI